MTIDQMCQVITESDIGPHPKLSVIRQIRQLEAKVAAADTFANSVRDALENGAFMPGNIEDNLEAFERAGRDNTAAGNSAAIDNKLRKMKAEIDDKDKSIKALKNVNALLLHEKSTLEAQVQAADELAESIRVDVLPNISKESWVAERYAAYHNARKGGE